MRAAWLLVAFLSMFPGLAASSEPSAKALRILFIGNDLIDSAEIPARVAKLAQALGRAARVESLVSRGYTLQDHFQESRTAAEIRKGWDVVVLQQGPSAREPERGQLMEYGKRLAAAAREAGAKPAFLMTWPRSDRRAEFRDAIGAYRSAADEARAILLPVGEAWLRALGADRRVRLYGDLTHAASLGSDLAVLTIYLSLFPAGPTEFDEAFVSKAARALEIPADRRDLLFDAATRAIDEPMPIK